MNILMNVGPDKVSPNSFYALIEISYGSKVKYKMDKETGLLKVARVLPASVQYPGNYGFIPRTCAPDREPLDVFILCREKLEVMSLVTCYPIGLLSLVEGDCRDDKIIAVPFADPTFRGITELSHLPEHVSDEISHFFSIYKSLEDKKNYKDEIHNADEAKKVIAEGIDGFFKMSIGRGFGGLQVDV